MIKDLLTIPSTDAEDARRRKLLNILLLGTMAVGLVALIVTLLWALSGVSGEAWEVTLLIGGSLGTLVGAAIIFLINRYGAGWLASGLFLLLLTVVVSFSDEPHEIAAGRSLFLLAIPIVMASVLLRPYASFIIAALVGVLISALASSINIVPNTPAILGFFVLALVSWLSARSLEQALDDLQAINRELDQRVAQRTRDLADALARVQAESSKNQAILESIADGVIVFDNFGKAIVANPSVTELLHYPVTDILGGDIQSLMSEHVSQDDQETVLKLFRDGSLQRSSVKFQWSRKTLSVSFAAVQDNSGKNIGHVMVCRDYTREAELDQMKSRFLSMTSHELRTPLNAILGYTDMLQEQVFGPLNPAQQGKLDRITANTKRMLALVNNLLDQAQIEAGRLSLTFAPFTLTDLIEELKSVMAVLAEGKGLEFTCTIENDVPPSLVSDAQRLQQILINLVGNAIKFTKKGAVRVRLYLTDGAHWAVEVSDTGPGIPADAHAYIFDAFRQVDDPVTRESGGSGLGLSIVKQLANLLGGDVKLTSTVGQGSTFTIVLPVKQVQGEMA